MKLFTQPLVNQIFIREKSQRYMLLNKEREGSRDEKQKGIEGSPGISVSDHYSDAICTFG